MSVHILYRVTNLASLQVMVDDILANTQAAAGRKVHPDEILVHGCEYIFVEATLASEKLTDGSEVFNVEVHNQKAPRAA